MKPATANASAEEAGSSATSSTARRPSTCACRSPTPRRTRSRPGWRDEDILMLADILPTGYEVGVLNGHVQPGDVVAVVGAGPIGLSAIMGARLFSPSHIVAIDLADSRLDAAKQFGADVVVNNGRQDALEVVRELDRRPRRRRRHRSRRHRRHLRARHDLDPPVRTRRQHRRARQARDPAPRAALGPGRDHHHRPRRHVLDADAAAAHAPAASSTSHGSSPTTSRWTTSSRRTTRSPERPTPVHSRSSSLPRPKRGG